MDIVCQRAAIFILSAILIQPGVFHATGW